MEKNTVFEGIHITARLGKHIISIRNNDNICSETIARSAWLWSPEKAWEAFLENADREMTFDEALAFFGKRKIKMIVEG
jgi:hypothetical protein